MAIEVTNTKDNKDINGGLGKAVLEDSKTVRVYRVRKNANFCNCNINIVNPTAVDANVQIWVSYEDNPDEKDLIESKVVLTPDAVYTRTNLVIGGNEAIFAKSDINGVVIRVEGFESKLL